MNSSSARMVIRPPQIDGPVAYIPLTKGRVAIIDAEDIPLVGHYNWICTSNNRGYVYAMRSESRFDFRKFVKMHREIMQATPGVFVDHANGDTLDNRKGNMRLSTRSENAMNSRVKASSRTGLKGVSWRADTATWRATITVDRKAITLGTFPTPEQAHTAYCEAAIKYHGEFANFGVTIASEEFGRGLSC